MRLVLLFSIAVSSYCFKFSLRWSKTINKSTKYSKSSQFQLYSSAGNFNSSVPDNQNMNSLAPISDVNIYGNMLESSAGSISKDFIPTGPPALTQYDKKTTFKNSAIMNSKSEVAKQYFEMVEKLSPNEMLQKFAETAPRNVQEATKSTIVNILGSLPNYALDAALITTSSKLANLLFQMQLTGYMFKNAEYRMSLTRSLKGYPRLPAPATINTGNTTLYLQDGTRAVGSVDFITEDGGTVAVSADSLMQALSKEVEELRTELALVRDSRETELRSNLLTYIQALPEKELTKLTADMSDDVLESIRMLVNALMERLGVDTTGPEMIIQQSVGAMAQLCMWQMVIGYKLREFEAFERGAGFDNFA